MEILTTVLGGIVIALVGGIAGEQKGKRDTVNTSTCMERQHACQGLLIEKIGHVEEKIDRLTKAVNNKLFGI